MRSRARPLGPASAPWPLVLALRYLRSGRKDAFVSFLSAVAVGGIALGVGALIVALAALSGLQHALREEVLSRTSEIEIEGSVEQLDAVVAGIASLDGVRAVERQIRGAGWVLIEGSARPVEVVGFEGELPPILVEGSGRSGVFVSRRLARLYGLEAGETVELASARPTLSPIGPVPRVRRVEITGALDGGVLERREMVALPLVDAIRLLGTGSLHLVVTTGDLGRALDVAAELRKSLPGTLRIRTWRDLNAPLLFALDLEKRLMFLAVFLIVLVGSLALISSISLVISSRRSEIAILGTLGAAPVALRRAFLTLGAILGGLGTFGGLVVGLVASWVLDVFELVRLPGDAYLLKYVPFTVELRDLAWTLGATLAIGLACAWYGATRISDLRPVEALGS